MRVSIMYAVRHIVRHRVKTLLIFVTTLFFVIALGLLQETISRTESEIDYLYATTIVSAEVRRSDGAQLIFNPRTPATGPINPRMVTEILNTGFIQNEFLQSIHIFSVVTPASDYGALRDDWGRYWMMDEAFVEDRIIVPYVTAVNGIIAVNDIGLYIRNRSMILNPLVTPHEMFEHWNPDTGEFDSDGWDQLGDGLIIELAEWFDEDYFVFEHGSLTPVIVSEYTAAVRGLSIGDIVYVSAKDRGAYQLLELLGVPDLDSALAEFVHHPAIIVGMHNRVNVCVLYRRDGIIAPIGLLEYMVSQMRLHVMGIRTFTFDIDPVWNRELDFVQERLQAIASRPDMGTIDLRVIFYDLELRIVVGSMEQNLSLLRLLYPVAIVISVIIGAGLSILLMLQNAKNAAIMRVLGSVKKQTRVALWIEQLIVCLAGLVIGLVAVFVLGWGAPVSVMLAGLYLAGVIIGVVVGSVLVTSKPPLELLQVRE